MSGQAGIEGEAGAGPWPQAPDVDLLGIEVDRDDSTRSRFVLERHLCRRDGALFGGTALGVTLAAFEAASERPSLWATVQFVATAAMGEEIECRVTPVARGRAVDQLQLTASVGDRVVFSAMGSTAAPRPDGISATGRTMPEVAGPEDGERLGVTRRETDAETIGHYLVSEFREVVPVHPASAGHVTMWSRIVDEPRTTAATLGFLADMVPIAVCRAAGIEGAGTSLDNSLRVGRLVDTE